MPFQSPYLGPMQGHWQFQQPQQQYQAQQQQYQAQQPVHGFVYVTGLDGAKAYQMPANSEMPLFDSTSDDRMFIKTTDGAGFPTIRAVKCTPEESKPQPSVEYAMADDVTSLRKELDDLRKAVYEMGGPRGKHVSAPAE